jgi:hypothetical protein
MPWRAEDPFAPVRAWATNQRCVVGGVVPPGASQVEVRDDRGEMHQAQIGDGAYISEVGLTSLALPPVVCCRDSVGRLVRRPRADVYPSAVVTNTSQPCPACGEVEWDQYVPTEAWRTGRTKPDGSKVVCPIVSCLRCGHEEPDDVFFRVRARSKALDDAGETDRVARHRAPQPRQWVLDLMAIRAADFPIYVAEGFTGRVGNGASDGGTQTQVTVYQRIPYRDNAPRLDKTPSLTVRTATADHVHHEPPPELCDTLELWINWQRRQSWPKASDAAITLWLRASQRQDRADVLAATRSSFDLTLEGVPVTASRLMAADGHWAAQLQHASLTLTLCGAPEVAAESVRLEPLVLSSRLLGPEPPDF